MAKRHLPPGAVHAAQQAKHGALVARLAVQRAGVMSVIKSRDAVAKVTTARRPYTYRHGMYRRSFLNLDEPRVSWADPPRVMYCFWTGDNELTPNRRRSLEVIRRVNPDIPVVLVTPANLGEFVLPEHPLHPAYEGLSLVHRSDYLRCYFMHHHGGGYLDIKAVKTTWAPHFDWMDAHPDCWVLGYRESSSVRIANMPRRLGRDVNERWDRLPAGGAFIMRPGTPLTAEWLAELHRRLDYYRDGVSRFPGGVKGDDPLYPVSWNRLLAQILQPLALKHLDHVELTDALSVVVKDYR